MRKTPIYYRARLEEFVDRFSNQCDFLRNNLPSLIPKNSLSIINDFLVFFACVVKRKGSIRWTGIGISDELFRLFYPVLRIAGHYNVRLLLGFVKIVALVENQTGYNYQIEPGVAG